jgi:hypothetical protein
MSERVIQARDQLLRITLWSVENIGQALPVTCIKDYNMLKFYDDPAVQVEMNTGRLVGDQI